MLILASTLVSALGTDKASHIRAWREAKTALSPRSDFHAKIPMIQTFLGEVPGLDKVDLPKFLAEFDCRNNRLAWQALQRDGFHDTVNAVVEKFGQHRVGLVVGTSTSGIAATEAVFRNELAQEEYLYPQTQQMDSLAQFCCRALNIEGPNFVISTACSSSAKVFEVAQRWLQAGIVDAVVVGGVDSLCLTTLHGFNALDLVSAQICKPLDAARDGINIGEAGGFMLLSHKMLLTHEPLSEESAVVDTAAETHGVIEIVGVGESSDAYHISTPHPEGAGAQLAMLAAMQQANIGFEQLDYINLHGTATPSNDLSEVSGIAHLSTPNTSAWMSSTKGFTGHTLGAAGITEVIFCQWALEAQIVPANLNLVTLDPVLSQKLALSKIKVPLKSVQLTADALPLRYAMSNSFGFGGNNASVILKRGPKR